MTDLLPPEIPDGMLQKKAVDAMIAMNAAIRTLHLYPVTSTACANAIEKAYSFISDILEKTGELLFAESEKRLLICGQPLSESELQKPQVSAFADLLLHFEIKELSLSKGLGKEEFASFLEIFAASPAGIREKGGLHRLLSEKKLPHVQMDRRRFVALEKDQQVGEKGKKSLEIEQVYGPMVETLDNILDSDNKDRVSRCLASSIVKKDENFLTNILVQKTEGELSQQLFRYLIDEMDEGQFEKLLFRIRRMVKTDTAGEKEKDTEAVLQTVRSMLQTPKGEMLQKRMQEKKTQARKEKLRQAARLRAGINSILNEEEKAFADNEVMAYLPGAILVLFEQKQNAAAEKLIDCLGEGLRSKNPEIRYSVARTLVSLIRQSRPERQKTMIRRLSRPMSDWIKSEREIRPEYGQICHYLKDTAQSAIREKSFEECVHIVEALHTACRTKEAEKAEDRMQHREILQELASEDVLELLLTEFMAKDTERRRRGALLLSRIGPAAAKVLLHLLEESKNRYERARILKTLSDIGPDALPALEEEIRKRTPWYYMRNLILLFGKTGNESHTDIIASFLTYKDIRVRKECLNTLFLIGGKQREKIFLSMLPEADVSMKINILKFLGRLKSRDAVPFLSEMLESKSILTSKYRSRLEEGICAALGQIGTPEAVAVLENIRDSEQKKRLLTRASDIEKRKAAAEKALKMMQQSRGRG
ncbi:MAG: HEAT repeat domain-containing protein [Desulfococcaceae bacterium]|jgi:HEAT repeat protein|nr:HEAT repeat domain-containing protein [Desulfococcaceae bacterium]